MNTHRNESASEWLVKQLFWVCTTTISAKCENNCLMFPTHSLLTDSQYFYLYQHKMHAPIKNQQVKLLNPPTHTHRPQLLLHSQWRSVLQFYRKLTYKASWMLKMPHCDSDNCSSTLVARMCSRLQPCKQTATFWLPLSNWYMLQLYLISVLCNAKWKL